MNNFKFGIAALLLAFLFIGIVSFANAAASSGSNSDDKRTITVSATSSASANPDKAEIYVGVSQEDTRASRAQDYVTGKMNAIRNALLLKGVQNSDIETTEYSLYPVYDYDRLGQQSLRGYRATHMVKVTTKDTAGVGALIDAAVEKGANQISSVQFGLTDAKTDELKLQAYKSASMSAKKKASSIAEGLDVKLGKISSVTDSTYDVVPYYSSTLKAAGISAESATQVDAAQVKISVTLSATFEIQ